MRMKRTTSPGAIIPAMTAASRTGAIPVTGPLLRIAAEALPPELAYLAAGPMAQSIAEAVAFTQNAVSATTLKIYGDDWAAFRAWCAAHGAPGLPAPPAIVAAYLAERSKNLGRSGLRVVLAAIAFHHRRAGHVWTAADPVIASVMRGILRTQRRPVRPAAALTSDEIRILLASCGDDPGGRAGLSGLRDRALLLTGFAGGLRRSELVGLDVADLRFTPDGVVLRIRQSKRDQEGQGADVGIAPGADRKLAPCSP